MIGRRLFCTYACAAVLAPGPLQAQAAAPASAGPADAALIEDIVTANRI